MPLNQNRLFPFDATELPDSEVLAETLADTLAGKIRRALEDKGSALLAFSGGSTPKPLFEALARQADIDWAKVKITLVDERFVDEVNPLSNAALIKDSLINLLPDEPIFVPLYREVKEVEEAYPLIIDDVKHQLDDKGLPIFDAVILGMGSDGHTASFFPDADNVNDLVCYDDSVVLARCESPSAQVPRITWSLSSLLNTEYLALHFTGESKKAVFNTAIAGSDASELPIRGVLLQSKTPLHVFYAP